MAAYSLQGGLFRSPEGEVPLVGGLGLIVPLGRPGEDDLCEEGEGDRDGLDFLFRRSLPVALGVRIFPEGCPPPSFLVGFGLSCCFPPDLVG